MKLRYFVVLVAALAGFGASAESLSNLPVVVLQDEGVSITEWMVVGPFEVARGELAMEVDFFNYHGFSESVFNPRHDFGAETPKKLPGSKIHRISSDGRKAIRRFLPPFPLDRLSSMAGYAACEIQSVTDREAWLLCGSNDPLKLWINGELLHVVDKPRGGTGFEDAVRLPLRSGRNLLLIKLAQLGVLTVRLEPDLNSAGRTGLGQTASHLTRLLVPKGTPVELSSRGVPPPVRIEAQLETYDGRVLRTLQIGPEAPMSSEGLESGLYRLKLELDGNNVRPPFYIGSLADMRKDFEVRCTNWINDERVKADLETLLLRLEIMSRPYKREPNEKPWIEVFFKEQIEFRAVRMAEALHAALGRLERGEEPFQHRPGLHLRGFRSRIDDQPQHYRLFVPSSYAPDGSGLPLIIVMTTTFQAARPYIESAFVAQQDVAEQWADVAEKLGVGVLWPGYRVCPYGNPIEFTHLDEVLQTVARDYRIDRSRLYLYGHCSSGISSAMEVLRHPDRYAAVALLNPVLHRAKARYEDTGDYSTNPTYREWLRSQDPLAAFAQVKDLPVSLIHDGVDPDHGPLSHSTEFVTMSRAYGNKVKFLRDVRPPSQRMPVIAGQMAWLAQQRLESPPTWGFASLPNGGPLSRVFADRFIVVRGTQGNPDQKAAAARWCEEFQDAWQRTNYGRCRTIDDVQLSAEEESVSNLILIGNAETNAVWRRLGDRAGVVLEKERVGVRHNKWEGADLALQTWATHPEHPSRKITFVGAYDLEQAAVGTMELALDGWFDFAIWQGGTGKPKLVAAGANDNRQ